MLDKKQDPLSKKAYQYLLDKLLKNQLVPGDIVNRRDVAHGLGMSVAPVLEAMLQLVSEGYLESMPRKGTRVRPVRAEDIKGQLIVRESLECGAARIYCGKPVQENYDGLAEIARRLDGFGDESLERWAAEIEFHQSLVHLSNVEALWREFNRIFRLTMFYRLNRAYGPQKGHIANRHLKLLDELLREDPAIAERAIRDHIRAGKEYLFE